ncbi:hypothetical protein [Paenarthrobacter ureafaciens]|uniref:hypothetical protein n=1 Tax=Paenarthrobacter ureafaciens TaxID=37931 RepID=UPI001407F853|nr:hypothetical protein [Paenarthrobacter ureafaciens]MCX8454908.1 hypothetical protein [Paenarthrobacter ureafaciens]MCY0973093.1 hypothetical protein [Paenarthrobacter ureafaciens]
MSLRVISTQPALQLFFRGLPAFADAEHPLDQGAALERETRQPLAGTPFSLAVVGPLGLRLRVDPSTHH